MRFMKFMGFISANADDIFFFHFPRAFGKSGQNQDVYEINFQE